MLSSIPYLFDSNILDLELFSRNPIDRCLKPFPIISFDIFLPYSVRRGIKLLSTWNPFRLELQVKNSGMAGKE